MESQEYNYITREILHLVGVDLNCYKSQQMQRRLNTFLLRSGHANWPSYFRSVRDDPGALRKLKDYLTINVSSFFRDPEKYAYLKEVILPQLLQDHSSLRIWSAGCSHGQEPYTLAMILFELTDPFRPHNILATDLDLSALEYARSGGPYAGEEVANLPAACLSRYFARVPGGYQVKKDLCRHITFRQHNLLADRFESRFDLIICRNVVIYFTAEVKDQLYRRFRDSLRPGGVLFVGGTEIVSKASEIGFESTGISFYRRRTS
jgi:chemotaxis protein methyltransferase CheR